MNPAGAVVETQPLVSQPLVSQSLVQGRWVIAGGPGLRPRRGRGDLRLRRGDPLSRGDATSLRDQPERLNRQGARASLDPADVRAIQVPRGV
jgi:hypothetical protein